MTLASLELAIKTCVCNNNNMVLFDANLKLLAWFAAGSKNPSLLYNEPHQLICINMIRGTITRMEVEFTMEVLPLMMDIHSIEGADVLPFQFNSRAGIYCFIKCR